MPLPAVCYCSHVCFQELWWALMLFFFFNPPHSAHSHWFHMWRAFLFFFSSFSLPPRVSSQLLVLQSSQFCGLTAGHSLLSLLRRVQPVCSIISAVTLRAVRLPAVMKKCETKAAPSEKTPTWLIFLFPQSQKPFFSPSLPPSLSFSYRTCKYHWFLFSSFYFLLQSCLYLIFPHHAEEALLVCAFSFFL